MEKFLNGSGVQRLWNKIKGELSNKAPTSHEHSIDDLTDLGTVVNSTTVNIGTSGWANNTLTVNAEGVTESTVVIVSPISSHGEAYVEAGMECTGKGTGTLTFTRKIANTSTITVNVFILGVKS